MLRRDNLYLLRQKISSYLGDIESCVVKEENSEFRYLESGRSHSDCIVFLHGLLGTKSQWRGLMEELSLTHRVIALDIPGLSSIDNKPWSSYDFYSLSAYLKSFLTSLGIQRATFVGHCIGGNLAQLFQNQHPNLVEDLILVSPVGMELNDPKILISKVSQFRHMLDFNSFDDFNNLVNNLFYQPIIVAKLLLELRMKDLIRNKDSIITVINDLEKSLVHTVNALAASQSRRLIICGDSDIFADKEDFKFFDQCANLQFELFDQCGHVPFLEYPKKTDQLVRNFLKNKHTS